MTDQGFGRLTENAFDFLGQALDQLETAPKHSVINFYAAVELFIKARLLLEHWTLVLAKEKSRSSFEEGDFQSASFDLACTRLDQVVGSPLPPRARVAFDVVRKHRNRMVHFHHAIQEGEPATIAAIAVEQLTAWHWLHELLTSQWATEFSDYRPQIEAITDRLTSHRIYVQVAYDNIRLDLQALSDQGIRLHACPFCELNTAVEREVEANLCHTECRICGHYWNDLYIECEECGASSTLMGGSSECTECTHVMYADDIERYVGNPGSRLAPCPFCHRPKSVLPIGGTQFCIGCLEIVPAWLATPSKA